MSLEPRGYVELPAHRGTGGFDHAAMHRASGQVYVAHTANDAIDVVDSKHGRYLRSIPGLKGVAGVLVSDERGLVFTSNRGEDTVSIFPAGREDELVKVKVGLRPNGLAFDPVHGLLLAANVGDPKVPGSYTITFVDVKGRSPVSNVQVSGRTRWSVYDEMANTFYVNIMDPAEIAVFDARDPMKVARTIPIPAAGPHGLDLDPGRRRLFCACDGAKLVTVDLSSGRIADGVGLSGVPDVVMFNRTRQHLYVAVGNPGVIDVVDTNSMKRIESFPTEKGAHTIALDGPGNQVYAFLPETHRALVCEDTGGPRS